MPDGQVNRNSQSAVYIASLGFYFSDDFHVAARLPSAIAGTLCIGLAFMAVLALTGNITGGLLAAILIAFSSTQITWSRQAGAYIYVAFFLLATIAALSRHFSSRRTFWLWMGLVMAALCIGAHAGGYVAGLLFGLYLFCSLGQQVVLHWSGKSRLSNEMISQAILVVVLVAGFVLSRRLSIGHSGFVNAIEMLKNPYKTNYSVPYN